MRNLVESQRMLRRVTGQYTRLVHEPSTSSGRTRGISCLTTSLGIPIYEAVLFPTVQVIGLIRTAQFQLPKRCVKCHRSSANQETFVAHSFWPLPLNWIKWYTQMPYCREHSAAGYPGAVLRCGALNTDRCMIYCLAISELFVTELTERARVGEMSPPWVAFPGSVPHFRWGQGIQQGWWTNGWEMFWKSLSVNEQAAYMQRWHAPTEWRSYLFGENRPEPANNENVGQAD